MSREFSDIFPWTFINQPQDQPQEQRLSSTEERLLHKTYQRMSSAALLCAVESDRPDLRHIGNELTDAMGDIRSVLSDCGCSIPVVVKPKDNPFHWPRTSGTSKATASEDDNA